MSDISMRNEPNGRMPADYAWRVMMMAGIGFWQIRLDGNHGPVLSVNDEYPMLLGLTGDTFTESFADFLELCVHPDDRRRAARTLSDLTPRNARFEIENRLYNARERAWCWFRVNGAVGEFDPDGRPTVLFGCIVDVNDAHRARVKIEEQAAALREERDRLDAIVGAGALMVWDWDLRDDTVRVFRGVNARGERRQAVGPVNEVWGHAIPPDEWRRVRAAKDRCARGVTRIYEVEYRAVNPDGSLAWWLDRGRIVHYDGEGRPTHLMGVTLDVTRQRAALLAAVGRDGDADPGSAAAAAGEASSWMTEIIDLERADRRVRAMLDAVPLSVTFWDEKTVPIDCNGYALELFNMPDKTAYLDRFYDLSPPFQPNGRPSREMARNYVGRALRDGQAEFRWLHQRPDGTPLPCEVLLRSMVFDGQKVAVGIARDLREIIARRAQATRAVARMRNILDSIPFAAMLFDADGRVVEGNAAAAALFGFAGRDDLIERFDELCPERQPDGRPSRAALQGYLDAARRDGDVRVLWRHRRPDRTPIPVRITLRALTTEPDGTEVVAFLAREEEEMSAAPASPAGSGGQRARRRRTRAV